MTSYRNNKHTSRSSSRATSRSAHRATARPPRHTTAHTANRTTPQEFRDYSRNGSYASKNSSSHLSNNPSNYPLQSAPRYTSRTANQFPTKLVVIVVALLAFIIGTTITIQSCSHSRNYDWQNLVHENGRIYYSQGGNIVSKTGIDVSSHQGTIDWNTVANDGIDFAMIRCGSRGYTEGNLYADETFYSNADGAQAAGVPFGVYFFSQATSKEEAIEEAEYVLQLIAGMEITCPIAYDLEDMPNHNARANDLTPEQCTQFAEAFCNRIKQAGYKTLVYGNQHDLTRYDLDHLKEDIWYAEYNDVQPTTNVPMVMWQYTSTGNVAGISTQVDLNVLFNASLIS